ncbi:MAG: type II secretion system protein GspC [Gammaproteobacteria bacterium]|nr:type II secretion system protein GspC [Gammaproteobacteria bacterium]
MQIGKINTADTQAFLRGFAPLAEKHLPLWASILLGILIAWSLSQLTWEIMPQPKEFTPAYKTHAAAIRSFDANKLANMHLFGLMNVSATTEAPATTLNLKLKGVVAASNDSKISLAIISSNNNEDMYGVGAQLPGGAQVQSIYPDHVLISFNGRIQSLQMPKPSGSGGGFEGVMGANFASPASSAGVIYGSNLPPMQNLSQLRSDLIKHPEHLLDVMRAMPVMKNGKLSGYRVYPVGNSNTFVKLGFKPGDIVTAVNGMQLDNPADSMNILNNLKTSEQISVTFIRNGQQQTKILQMQNSSIP